MYLQPTINIEETVDIIKECIESTKPLSLTRFGDGEIHILNKNGLTSFNIKLCNEYGYKYPEECDVAYKDGFNIIVKGITQSDIIGIMDKNCPILPIKLYSDIKWSITKDNFEKYGGNINNIKICDHMISRHSMLGELINLKKIINGKDIHIISPNTKLLESKKLDKLLNCKITYTYHPYSINLNNREQIINNFSKINENIVFYGCGLQKDYGVILRDEYNKIAIDMGATIDAWAGIISRPWFNNGMTQNYLLNKN